MTAVSSVDRVLIVLSILRGRGHVRVVEVADELGVAPSTAHRLLVALVRHGFAVQGRGRVYSAGPELELPRRAVEAPDLIGAARPHLEALSSSVGETAHLMVLEGASARFVFGVEGTHAVRVAGRIGLVLPAHVTSGGKVLLAELDRSGLGKLYPSGLALTPDARGPVLPELRRELTIVRRRGYALNAEQSEQGVNAIGVCVRDHDGRAVAAVVIAAPSMRMPMRTLVQLAPRLGQAARDIGAALGSGFVFQDDSRPPVIPDDRRHGHDAEGIV